MSFDIKFTRRGLENAWWHREACWAIHHAFSMPSLVNLISKQAHLVFCYAELQSVKDHLREELIWFQTKAEDFEIKVDEVRRSWCFNRKYLHFRSKPLMNLYIFATVHSLMNYTNLIDSYQDHLPVQHASNIKLFCQKWYWCCDWHRATTESHVQNTPLVCSIGCPCSRWLFRLSL